MMNAGSFRWASYESLLRRRSEFVRFEREEGSLAANNRAPSIQDSADQLQATRGRMKRGRFGPLAVHALKFHGRHIAKSGVRC
jgi:hypothetical protein